MAHSGSVFKSVCEDILEPRGIKVGGYKDDIFDALTDVRREELSCQICFMVAKDPHTCSNKHLFCGGCIFAWSMTSETNTDRCPVCRVRGAYCSDDTLNSSMSSMAVKCLQCKWRGQLSDYRSHSHGLEDVGIDPKMAGLPSIFSSGGEIVFPDLVSADNFGETVDTSRRRHQRRYLDTQLELVEGQARLTFLLDVFEEDLQSHRDRLSSLVGLQRRYNAEQLNEVMRLEAELGQITSNLLGLIESASNDVSSMTDRLRTGSSDAVSQSGGAPSSIQSTITRLSSYTARLRNQGVATANSFGPVEEPRDPVRRAHFFSVRQQDPSVSQSLESILEPTAARSQEASTENGSLLTRRDTVQRNTLPREDNSNRHNESPSSNMHSRINTATRSTTSAMTSTPSTQSSNPFSITYPPQTTRTTGIASVNAMPSLTSQRNRSTATDTGATSQTQIQGPSTTSLHNLPSVTAPAAPATPVAPRSSLLPRPPSRPRVDTAARSNPYTITWPPAANNTPVSIIVTRHELRRNAGERTRRTDGGS